MLRSTSLEEISDGKLYRSNDMVRLDADGCNGCSYCCREMTDTIILDPWDVFQLVKGYAISKAGSYEEGLNYLIANKLIVPAVFDYLTMFRLGAKNDTEQGTGDSSCMLLDENGRCMVHDFRPGFCRLFPLGRYYEDGGFSYFLQKNECQKPDRSKVKISKWLGIKELAEYEKYIQSWHDLTENVRAYVKQADDETARKVTMMFLKTFYLAKYDPEKDFYQQYYNLVSTLTK